ncbi:unnamed protein product [Adineta steineri]|uniref:Uncharacterized protein n=1 Tax=Adineta steineri TaxID=433720 RepID=A0A815R1L0_9BILA|nr:unnamed protein product [Adineta steineri]CAF1470864.1 unnamed protein product [Adineta steineri]CAF1508078.1 unnamed protein product [Adineta steineri]
MLHHIEFKWSSIYSIHGLRNRIVRILLQTFHSERLPLVGLCEMDQKTIEELVFPIIRTLGYRIKYIPPTYHTSHSTPDDHEHFKEELSNFYGERLYTQVTQLRQQPRSTKKPTQIETSTYSKTAVDHCSSPVIMNNLHNNKSFYSTRSLSYSDMDLSQ